MGQGACRGLDITHINVSVYVWKGGRENAHESRNRRPAPQAGAEGRWHRTKKATVNEALAEYVQRRKQQKILKLFGRVDYDPTYDHKAGRKNR